MSETAMINPITFEAWPKTPRLSNGGVTITEKIDGTNACVVIMPQSTNEAWGAEATEFGGLAFVPDERRPELQYLVGAQSRTRLIFPGSKTDNAGFAGWVFENRERLVDLLGPGRHFGEWWGQGIQRRYGMDRKVFSLFHYHKWSKIAQQRQDWRDQARDINMATVPLISVGRATQEHVDQALNLLRENGSFASAEWGVRFDRPEGIIVRHDALGGNLKAFVEDADERNHKGGAPVNQINGLVSGKVIQGGDFVGPVSL